MALTFNITKSGSIAFSAYAETGSAGFSAKITLNGVEDTLYSHAPTHSAFCKVIQVKEGDVLEINHIDQYEQLMVMIGRYAISNTAERLNKPVKVIEPEDAAEYTISGELTDLGIKIGELESALESDNHYTNSNENLERPKKEGTEFNEELIGNEGGKIDNLEDAPVKPSGDKVEVEDLFIPAKEMQVRQKRKLDLKYYKNMFYNGTNVHTGEITFNDTNIKDMSVYIKNDVSTNDQNESLSKEIVTTVKPAGTEGIDYTTVEFEKYIGLSGYHYLEKPEPPEIEKTGNTWVLHPSTKPSMNDNEKIHYNFIPVPKPNLEDYSSYDQYYEAEQKMLYEWYNQAFIYEDPIEINQYYDIEIYAFTSSEYETGYILYSNIVSERYKYYNENIPQPIITVKEKDGDVYFEIDKNSEDPNLVTRYYIYEEYNYDGIANYDRYFGCDVREDKDGKTVFNISHCYHEPLTVCNTEECKIHNGKKYQERNYWVYYDLDSFGCDEGIYNEYKEALKLTLPDIWYYTDERDEEGNLKRHRKIEKINFRIYALNEYDEDHDDTTINSSYGPSAEVTGTI